MMHWAQFKQWGQAAAPFAFLALLGGDAEQAGATGGEAVVLASTAPGYHTGKVLEPAGAVSVPDQATLSLLFDDGRMLTLDGPYTGKLAEASFEEMQTAPGLAMNIGLDHSTLGGTRSANDAGQSAVEIDLVAGGRICIDPRTQVYLHGRRGASWVSITDAETGDTATLPLDGPGSRAAWPYQLEVEGAARYSVSIDDQTMPPLELVMRREPARDVGTWLAFLKVFGCDRQLGRRLEAARDQLVPFGIYLTSSGGRQPRLDRDSNLSLYLRANRDGYAYCFAEDQFGRMVPFFPRRPEDAAINGERFVAVMGPGEARSLAERLGRNARAARCIGSSVDLAESLPREFVEGRLAPVSPEAEAAMQTRLRNEAPIATAQLALD